MTLFQCRRFQLFDLERVDRDFSIKENLKGYQIQCGTSGRGRILLGSNKIISGGERDTEGYVHSISKHLDAQILVVAHPRGIILMQQLKQSPILATLGMDAPDVYSVKIWDETIIEIEVTKNQLLLKRELRLSRTIAPSCFTLHENLQLLAVGYNDGLIQLYRGEITRNRSLKLRTLLFDGEHGQVTGLFFKTLDTSVILFASTTQAVFSFDVTNKDREVKIQGDKPGCALHCSCYTVGAAEDHFIVGRNDAVYCYTHEGRGPCYGFDGDKSLLYYFRGYLLIITQSSSDTYNMTVFDCTNKFVGFSSSITTSEPIRVAAGEWSCLFLITADGSLWQLKEKDLQTKMGVFYKKNHYDLAIKVAKSNNFDADGMSDIFQKYGDHLYNKGDLDGAIRQYCKTVGKLEASYVVRKYLDASRILNLLEYLEVVHKTGHATADLTTLLLNCLTKLKLKDKIEHYVKDPSCNFLEPETAIKVFRRGGMSKQAYQLAQKHKLYGSALQILLEDVKDPCKEDLYDVLEKIVQDENAEVILKRSGNALVQLVGQVDNRSTDGWKKIVRLLCESPVKRNLVELFISKQEILLPLLENICQEFQTTDGPLMNLCLEAYLAEWSQCAGGSDGKADAINEKINVILSKAPNCKTWDWPRALFACKKFGHSKGEITAYEQQELHNDLLAIRWAAAQRSPQLWTEFIKTCRTYAASKPTLWKDAFNLITTPVDNKDSDVKYSPPKQEQHSNECPPAIIEEILSKLLDENLMEPLPILDKLCQTKIKLGSVRSFLTKVMDRRDIEEDEKQSKQLQEETSRVRRNIHNIRNKPFIFQSSRCNACNQKLDFPSVHFLCSHSFHQHCFDNFSEDDRNCPSCWSKNKATLGPELSDNRPSRGALDADFSLKMSTAKSNAFSVLADFLSKGIFKDSIVQRHPSASQPKKNVEKLRVHRPEVEEPSSEGRLRLREGTNKGSFASQMGTEVATIDSYLESTSSKMYEHSIGVGGNESEKPGFGARTSTTNYSTASTSLPFPRVPQSTTLPSQTSNVNKTIVSSSSPKSTARVSSSVPKNTSTSISAAAARSNVSASKHLNPFEDEENESDKNNPFLDSETAAPKNPFEEDDDYDSKLNPFQTE